MEFLYEAIVMGHLTRNNHFVCPQYSIKPERGKGEWRCPDFVVLDFDTPQVIIAEVTTGADMRSFATKAKEMYDHGRDRIKANLVARAQSTIPNVAEWPVTIQLFVRESLKDKLSALIAELDVQAEVIPLELAFQRWNPANWQETR